MRPIILGAIIVIFIITLVLLRRHDDSSSLTGFWRASELFCRESGVSEFLICIGEKKTLSSRRKCFIFMFNDQGMIINNPADIELSGIGSLSPIKSEHLDYTAKINWIDSEGYEFFPNVQKLHYYPQKGKIVMEAGKKVTGIFYKDYALSDVAEVMPQNVLDTDEDGDEI